ncbi:hypothetical protein PsYK624_159970 [Phanerochaete sordida]|uniref:Uncharacterized protein n=1 Tax=Phanerochaete sordida TaxID=48140 RepID=A0A9P3GRB3_9APHY|nr:hypothetical protein PsYK624_159970 [Phanerochaete sordida]
MKAAAQLRCPVSSNPISILALENMRAHRFAVGVVHVTSRGPATGSGKSATSQRCCRSLRPLTLCRFRHSHCADASKATRQHRSGPRSHLATRNHVRHHRSAGSTA